MPSARMHGFMLQNEKYVFELDHLFVSRQASLYSFSDFYVINLEYFNSGQLFCCCMFVFSIYRYLSLPFCRYLLTIQIHARLISPRPLLSNTRISLRYDNDHLLIMIRLLKLLLKKIFTSRTPIFADKYQLIILTLHHFRSCSCSCWCLEGVERVIAFAING